MTHVLPVLRPLLASTLLALLLVGAGGASAQMIRTNPEGESCAVSPDCKENKYDFAPGPGQTFMHWQVRGDLQLLTPEDQNPALVCSKGYGKGRLTAHYYTLRWQKGERCRSECPDTVYCTLDYDLFKRFKAPAPIAGPTCVAAGQPVTYWVPPILTDWPHRRVGIGTDCYFWSGFPDEWVVNISGDSSVITLQLPEDATSFTLSCRVGRCNEPLQLPISRMPLVPSIAAPDCLPYTAGASTSVAMTIQAEAGVSYVWSKPASWGITPANALTGITPPMSGPMTVQLTPDRSSGNVMVMANSPYGCAPAFATARLNRELVPGTGTLNNKLSDPGCLQLQTPVTVTLSPYPANSNFIWQIPAGWTTTALPVSGLADTYLTSVNTLTFTPTSSAPGTIKVMTEGCPGGVVSRPVRVSSTLGCNYSIVRYGTQNVYFELDSPVPNCLPNGNGVANSGITYTWTTPTTDGTGQTLTVVNGGPYQRLPKPVPANAAGFTVRIQDASQCLDVLVAPAVVARPTPPGHTAASQRYAAATAESQRLSAYPNPVDASLNVNLPAITETPGAAVRLTLTDVTGRVRLLTTINSTTTALDVRPLPEGVYALKAYLPNGHVLNQMVQIHH